MNVSVGFTHSHKLIRLAMHKMVEANLIKSKLASTKEKEVCRLFGYKICDTFLGGGAVGRVFLAEASQERIEANEKLKAIHQQGRSLQVRTSNDKYLNGGN